MGIFSAFQTVLFCKPCYSSFVWESSVYHPIFPLRSRDLKQTFQSVGSSLNVNPSPLMIFLSVAFGQYFELFLSSSSSFSQKRSVYYLSILSSHFYPPAFTLPPRPSPFYLILIYCWSEPWQQNQLLEEKRRIKIKPTSDKVMVCLQWFWWHQAELNILHSACILSAFVSCSATVPHKIMDNKLFILSVWFQFAMYREIVLESVIWLYFPLSFYV